MLTDAVQSARSPRRIPLRIHGMTCGACVGRVERALRAVEGVSDAVVNLAGGTAVVTLVETGTGMPDAAALTRAVEDAGYRATAADARSPFDEGTPGPADESRDARQRRRAVIAAAVLGLPVMALHLLARPSAFHEHGLPASPPVQAALVLAMLLSAAGAPILRGGFRAARRRAPNMDLLIAMGVTAAFAGGLAALAGAIGTTAHAHTGYFDTAAMILLFVNVGKYLEARARGRASSALRALARRAPQTALQIRDGKASRVPVAEVRVGDHLRVSADEFVPVDGRVIEGEAAVDQSMLTGESVPVDAGPGSSVYGGTLVTGGSVLLVATAVGADSAVARIARLVEQAQAGRTRLQRIADRAAAVFVPIVMLLAAVTFIGWLLAGLTGGHAHPSPIALALARAIAVLVVACPCAMGLATPAAVMVATGNAALRGILVRDAAALEAAGRADIVLLDKTGTLTTGRPTVTEIAGTDTTIEPRELLRLAASAEQFSQHPLAHAIVARAKQDGIEPAIPDAYEQRAGLGVSALLGGRRILVGSPAFLEGCGADCADTQGHADRLAREGRTVILVAVDGRPAGLIAIADRPRPAAARAIDDLRRLGLDAVMVTGDDRRTATAVAAAVGIQDVQAELSPDGKVGAVRELQSRGRRVIFVGDGINDAPALAAADAGIAFAAGTDIAAEAAGITLVGSDLRLVVEAVLLARRSVRIIRQNLFWAFAYNVAAIPLAATGVLPAPVAAATMMLSSISVVLNSLRLQDR